MARVLIIIIMTVRYLEYVGIQNIIIIADNYCNYFCSQT